MSGEKAEPQPGRRSPAPGELAIVQAFLNSHFDLIADWGADLLASPEGLQAWFTQRGLLAPHEGRLRATDVERALAVREGLRSLARRAPVQRDAVWRALNRAAEDLPLRLVFGEADVRLLPAGSTPIDRALGAVLSIAFCAIVDGTWRRLKICPGDHCGWAFYDHSRNQSGRWCSMSVCGGRAKARSYYRRHTHQG